MNSWIATSGLCWILLSLGTGHASRTLQSSSWQGRYVERAARGCIRLRIKVQRSEMAVGARVQTLEPVQLAI